MAHRLARVHVVATRPLLPVRRLTPCSVRPRLLRSVGSSQLGLGGPCASSAAAMATRLPRTGLSPGAGGSTPSRRWASTGSSSTYLPTSYALDVKANADIKPEEYAALPTVTTCILAHIDHGKSTLADRLLELTGTIPKVNADDPRGVNRQVLDTLQVERERGITVKSQSVSMVYTPKSGRQEGQKWLLNLIDTPGHVDFSYEVARSLSACQTALLLVDATQGVQAQTISVFNVARAKKDPPLKIIPVLNKIDMHTANVPKTISQLRTMLGLDVRLPNDPNSSGTIEPLLVSAKTGLGVPAVLDVLVDSATSQERERGNRLMQLKGPAGSQPTARVALPPLTAKQGGSIRAHVFDSWFDNFRGVIALVSIQAGAMRKGQKIVSSLTGKSYDVLALGLNHPSPVETPQLRAGQVGWVACNMRNVSEAAIHDVFYLEGEPMAKDDGRERAVQAAKAHAKHLTPMVFAGLFPADATEFGKLEESIQKLAVNDRSVSVQRESSLALGTGFRCGFLGSLHLDVFRQRLQDEFRAEVIATAPTVPYKIVYRTGKVPESVKMRNKHRAARAGTKGGGAKAVADAGPFAYLEEEITDPDLAERTVIISNPIDFPDASARQWIERIEEPMVKGRLRVPGDYMGEMMTLCVEHRGEQLDAEFAVTGLADDSGDAAAAANDDPTESMSYELVYRLPLAEVVTDFYDKLKSRSSGFATFEYEADGWARADVVGVSFHVARAPVDALAAIAHRSKATYLARQWAAKLKTHVERQMFEIAIQGLVEGKVVARETISAYRKDVTQGMYGGDRRRKMKLWEKQKAGKARTQASSVGKAGVSQEALAKVLSNK